MWSPMLLRLPIIGAPMAGGPSTPQLAAAVSNAGGLGMLAAGYRTADALAADIAAVRSQTDSPFGVNLFVPASANLAEGLGGQVVSANDAGARAVAVERYARQLSDVEGIARDQLGAVNAADDDGWNEKLELLIQTPVAVVTFTFGVPAPEVIARFRRVGTAIGVTVTDEREAVRAEVAGTSFLIVQGAEAGGHRGTHRVNDEPNDRETVELVAAIRGTTDLPLVAAGGIVDEHDAEAAMSAGASAVQIGTALLLADEAGTNPVHRAALRDPAFTATAITRAYSGRPARTLTTQFAQRHPDAPAAYPEVNQLTGPIRQAAKATGDPHRLHLWAGTGWQRVTGGTAGQIAHRIAGRFTRDG